MHEYLSLKKNGRYNASKFSSYPCPTKQSDQVQGLIMGFL